MYPWKIFMYEVLMYQHGMPRDQAWEEMLDHVGVNRGCLADIQKKNLDWRIDGLVHDVAGEELDAVLGSLNVVPKDLEETVTGLEASSVMRVGHGGHVIVAQTQVIRANGPPCSQQSFEVGAIAQACCEAARRGAEEDPRVRDHAVALEIMAGQQVEELLLARVDHGRDVLDDETSRQSGLLKQRTQGPTPGRPTGPHREHYFSSMSD